MKLLANSLYTFLSNVSGGAFLLLTNIIIARFLGAELFGVYSLVLALVSFGGVMAQLGMESVLVRELSRSSKNESLVLMAFVLRFFSSLFAVVCLWITSKFFGYSEIVQYGVFVASGSLVAQSFVGVAWSFFQSRFEMNKYAITHIIGRGMMLFLSWLFIMFNKSVLWLLGAYTIAGFVQLIVSFFLLKKVVSRGLWRWKQVVFLLRESLPLLFAGLFISFYYRADVLMISWWLDQASVGYYAAVYTITEAPVLLAVAVNASLYPLFSRLVGRADFCKVVRYGSKFVFLFAFPLAIGTMILSPSLVKLIYGDGFDAAIQVMQVLTWAGSLIMINVVLASVLNALGLQKVNFWASSINFCLNVILNAWAIPHFGVVGAAGTTVLTEFFACFILVVVLLKKGVFPFSFDFFHMILASVLMGLVVFIVREMLILVPILFGIITYVSCLVASGALSKNDDEMTRKVWGGSFD